MGNFYSSETKDERKLRYLQNLENHIRRGDIFYHPLTIHEKGKAEEEKLCVVVKIDGMYEELFRLPMIYQPALYDGFRHSFEVKFFCLKELDYNIYELNGNRVFVIEFTTSTTNTVIKFAISYTEENKVDGIKATVYKQNHNIKRMSTCTIKRLIE